MKKLFNEKCNIIYLFIYLFILNKIFVEK